MALRDRLRRRWLAGSIHWWLLLLPLLLGAHLAACVDLEPRVGRDFFFSSGDAGLQEAERLERTFKSRTQLILSVTGADLEAERTRERIAALTEQIRSIEQVVEVKSLTRGPDDLEDARSSPLWRRLLLGPEGRATHVIALVRDDGTRNLVERAEAIRDDLDAPGFRIQIAGVPYVVENIRRKLVRDFTRFTGGAVVLLGLAVLAIFRSPRILLGALVACSTATALTLELQVSVAGGIGLLTANLTIIVFVLTLSHIAFLSFNWIGDAAGGDGRDIRPALGRTWNASLWSMLTTLLGFTSLLFVQAKPLRELGVGGAAGSLVALGAAYALYPPFLAWAARSERRRALRPPLLGRRRLTWLAAGLFLACVAAGSGLFALNTDPSLLDYFERGGKLRRGLVHLDRNGGSSPLQIAVRREGGGRLDSGAAYDDMWDLHRKLESDPSVGTVVSLPVIMAEADRHPLSFLLSWDWLLDLLESPAFDRIARAFVNGDRTLGLFLLRMQETDREIPRTQVIDRLRDQVSQAGFEPALVGGVYALQAHLSEKVSRSVATGVSALVAVFVLIALAVARQLRTALAMVLTLAVLPLALLGGQGLLGVPLDVISAPAVNVALGLAADAIIHLTREVRRQWQAGRSGWQAWVRARDVQTPGILASAGSVAAGFALFGLSSFPPTQRFGTSVAAGSALAALLALLVLPVLASGRD